jgi:hypothetical protein
MRKLVASTFALLSLVCTSAKAGPMDRILMLDVGFGWPQLAGAEATIYITSKFYAGLTFGLLPGGNNLFPQQTMQEQSTILPDGNRYSIAPTLASTFFSVSPFVRFFLSNERPVYLQMMCAAFTSVADITGPIKDNTGTPVPGASFTGKVILSQLMPTLSLGHIWHSKFYFFNLSLGVTYVANILTRTQSAITLPIPIDTSEAEQMIADSITASAEQASNNIRQNVTFLPSIWVSFGLVL